MPTVLRVFRILAIAEAGSWAGLLIGMLFKYGIVGNDLGVKVFGPVHGFLFVLYALGVVATALELGWRPGTIALGLACGVPPFASVWFERRAVRRYRAQQVVEAIPEPVQSRQ